MTLEQMNYVVVLAEELSFTNACLRLHITQPALSQSIKGLEKQLGVLLFRRTTSAISLTYAGEQFVQAARSILETNRNLLSKLEDISNLERGRLIVGVPNFRGQIILSKTVPAFKKRYPNIEFSVVEENTEKLLEITEKGLVDLSIMNRPGSASLLTVVPICDERILVASPPDHPLCAGTDPENQDFSDLPGIHVSKLRDEPFIILRGGHKLRETTEKLFREKGLGKNIALEVNNLPTAQQLVANGLGFTFIGEMAARYVVQSPRPVYLRLLDAAPTHSIVAAYKTGSYLSHTTTAYLRLVRDTFSNLESFRQ